MTDKVAILGTGLVGSAWAIVFARAGRTVSLFDAEAAQAEQALDDMRHHLGKELLQSLMDAADAPEAVSGIAGAMIDPLRTHIEAFVKEQGLS